MNIDSSSKLHCIWNYVRFEFVAIISSNPVSRFSRSVQLYRTTAFQDFILRRRNKIYKIFINFFFFVFFNILSIKSHHITSHHIYRCDSFFLSFFFFHWIREIDQKLRMHVIVEIQICRLFSIEGTLFSIFFVYSIIVGWLYIFFYILSDTKKEVTNKFKNHVQNEKTLSQLDFFFLFSWILFCHIFHISSLIMYAYTLAGASKRVHNRSICLSTVKKKNNFFWKKKKKKTIW